MGRAQSRSILSQSIAETLGTAQPEFFDAGRPGPLRRSLIYSSMALLAISPTQVNAVGLGELNVQSSIGQPLNAVVPITLAAGESLPKNCVAPTRGNSGIGTPATLRVTTPAATQPGTYNLRVTTTNALHEPMYEVSLLIDCPGTPLLLRQYMLMLDLPGIDVSPVSTQVATRGDTLAVSPTPTQNVATAPQRSASPATNQPVSRSLQRSGASIPAGQSYRVREGDTLSTIATRVEGRVPDTIWSTANLIFASNPQAFIRNNPNLIKLGSKIDIPGVTALAGLKRGRLPMTSVTATEPDAIVNTSGTEPRPAPIPAPVPAAVTAPVASSRPEVFINEPEPVQPESTILFEVQDVPVETTEEIYEPFAAQPATDSIPIFVDEGPAITPFVDEMPSADAEVNVAVAEFETQAIPEVTATAQTESNESVNPLLAILVGILLGALVSLVMLRRQLIDALTGLLRRRSQTDVYPNDDFVSTATDGDNSPAEKSFDTSVAEAAFETQDREPVAQEEPEPLPIGSPAENTYIVETSEAESSAQFEIPASEVQDIGEPLENPDDEMLAMLFDDSNAAFGESNEDIFDPTGGDNLDETDALSGETVEMAHRPDEHDFDPTAAMPAQFSNEDFEATAEMPSGNPDLLFDDSAGSGETPIDPGEAVDPSLLDALDETVFSESNELANDLPDESPTARMPDEPTLESELDALPSGDGDDLSETLHEALSMLERDFEDEFTASQIIERSEISRALDKGDSGDETIEDDDPTDTLVRDAT